MERNCFELKASSLSVVHFRMGRFRDLEFFLTVMLAMVD